MLRAVSGGSLASVVPAAADWRRYISSGAAVGGLTPANAAPPEAAHSVSIELHPVAAPDLAVHVPTWGGSRCSFFLWRLSWRLVLRFLDWRRLIRCEPCGCRQSENLGSLALPVRSRGLVSTPPRRSPGFQAKLTIRRSACSSRRNGRCTHSHQWCRCARPRRAPAQIHTAELAYLCYDYTVVYTYMRLLTGNQLPLRSRASQRQLHRSPARHSLLVVSATRCSITSATCCTALRHPAGTSAFAEFTHFGQNHSHLHLL